LTEYPPEFYLGRGRLVRDGSRYEFPNTPERVPVETFIDQSKIDWDGCDRRVEYRNGGSPEGRQITVHEWIEEYCKDRGPENQIIFRDHSKGEIADYIQINPEEKYISFYHCKSGAKTDDGELSIGASLGRVAGVLDQVLRSVLWVKNPRLLEQIRTRNDRDIEPHFIFNDNKFYNFYGNFEPAEYDYEVISVLPSLVPREARMDSDVNALLATCIEWLNQVDASFRIIGDDGTTK